MGSRWKLLGAGVVAVALLVSCGGGADSASPTAAADTGNGASGDSGDAGEGGSPESTSGGLPTGAGEDFPIAIPDGWVIDFYGETGITVNNAIQVLYPNDDFDSIVAFYDDWTAGESDEWLRTDADDMVIFRRATDQPGVITVTRNSRNQGEFYTVLQASASTG